MNSSHAAGASRPPLLPLQFSPQGKNKSDNKRARRPSSMNDELISHKEDSAGDFMSCDFGDIVGNVLPRPPPAAPAHPF